jgi:hypothetical protein
MAQIDPNIALGFRMPQIQDPLVATARAQEIGVNALKMQELQRGMQEEQEVRNFLRSADLAKPETRAQLSQFGKTGLGYGKLLAEQEKAGLETKKLKGDITKQELEVQREQFANLAFNPSNENITAHIQDSVLQGKIPEAQAQQLLNQVLPLNPAQRKQFFTEMGVKAEKRYEMGTISAAQQQTADLTRRGQDITLRGQDLGRIPVGYRQTATGEIEPIPGGPTTTTLSPKEIQVREAKRPQATLALKTFEDKTTTLEKDIKELINHPGLPSITGIAAGRLPGITAEGRAAEALFNRIQKAGGFRELQEMRNASPTGGALGQVSNQENTSLQQTFAAIDRTQNAADVKKGLNKALDELTQSKGRVREAFDMTYDYRPADSAPPAAPATPSAPSAGGNTVTIPGGKVLTFPTPEAAAAYKKAAGL